MNYLRILAYHRIADLHETSSLNPRLISATPSVFASQMKYLTRFYNVVSIEDVIRAVQMRSRLPKRAVLITFDDAYCDFGENAWPILKRHGLPATVFVPTAYPDNPQLSFWWDKLYKAVFRASPAEIRKSQILPSQLDISEDRLAYLKKLQNHIKTLDHEEAMNLVDDICVELNASKNGQKSAMSWEELRKLKGEGLALGAHTQTHPILTRLPLDKARQEVIGSLEDLRRETGSDLPIFCYPGGYYNHRIARLLSREKILLAFSDEEGHNHLKRADLLSLRRTNITRRTSTFIFRLRLLRSFNYLDKWRRRLS